MAVKFSTNTKYIILGGDTLGNLECDNNETILVSRPMFDLGSPRTINLTTNPIIYNPGETVYFSVGYEKNIESGVNKPVRSYNDIYEFILHCRASKDTNNFYLPRAAESIDDIVKYAIKPYNLVSGDELPNTKVPLIHKYMMMGLHTFWVLHRRGLGNTDIYEIYGRPHIVSAGGHIFHKGDGATINTSTLFIALLIDYYKIRSGIAGMDSQVAFIRDTEYRYLIYKYIKSVFVTFISNNYEKRFNERITVNDSTDADIIIKLSAKILSSYIN